MIRMNKLIEYMDELFPNPRCELNYKKDYELLIAVMLSAQTTDKRVNQVTEILFNKYASIDALKEADIEDIEQILRPIGTFHKKTANVVKIAKKLADNNYIVPNNRIFLESLDGVGRKTTNVVLSNLYNEPYMAVDTHVTRISKRLGIAKNNDDVYSIEKKLIKKIPKDKICNMHHQLVLFGRYYCKAINPLCESCKLKDMCKRKKDN